MMIRERMRPNWKDANWKRTETDVMWGCGWQEFLEITEKEIHPDWREPR